MVESSLSFTALPPFKGEGKERRMHLTSSYMKTTLFQLIFDIASVRFAKITKHLGQYQFQRIRTDILHGPAIRVLYLIEPTVTYIESGPEGMGRVGGSIPIATAKAFHIVCRTKHGGDNDLIRIQPLAGQ